MLSQEEESVLLAEIHESEGEKKQAAINRFVVNQEALVRHWANIYYPKLKGRHEKRDLIQTGYMAVRDTLDRWDFTSRQRFATFATFRIKTAIKSLDKKSADVLLLGHLDSFVDTERGTVFSDLDIQLRALPTLDRLIIRLIYGIGCEPMSQRELSEVTGFNRRFLRETLEGAINTLRIQLS